MRSERRAYARALCSCRYPPMTADKLKQLARIGKRLALPAWVTGVLPLLFGAFVLGVGLGVAAVALAARR